jgi:signal transduction histidine kinase
MDTRTLNSLFELFQRSAARPDWKAVLESLALELRSIMVFDNLAVYMIDPVTRGTEVAYARALGRGRNAEADAAWGDRVAAEVIARGEVVIQTPTRKPNPDTDRLEQSFLLGLPIHLGTEMGGAVVFIRFGGPAYSDEHLHIAAMVGLWMAQLFERNNWQAADRKLQEIQRRIRLQDDFVATISHELRTPLGFIKGYTTTLLRQDTSWDAETQREFLTIIEEETDRLTQLIEDLLESSRLQSNTLTLKFQPMRIDSMIRDVILRVRQHNPGLSIKLDIQELPSVPGDIVHLTRVFENLFSNAVKYAPGSPIELNLELRGKILHIRFADHGPGIPAQHIEMIFERFYRVPDEATSRTGTGLGLYICKQIITAHHGKIWAESAQGQGTIFHIELPLEAPSPGKEPGFSEKSGS